MKWMLMPYRRYFEGSGRSQRMEYWMFMLFIVIVSFGLSLLFGADISSNIPLLVFLSVTIFPWITVQVRRFHDQDKSGWFFLLRLIPYVGGLIVLVFMALEGTQGENRFGPDPKEATDTSVFE